MLPAVSTSSVASASASSRNCVIERGYRRAVEIMMSISDLLMVASIPPASTSCTVSSASTFTSRMWVSFELVHGGRQFCPTLDHRHGIARLSREADLAHPVRVRSPLDLDVAAPRQNAEVGNVNPAVGQDEPIGLVVPDQRSRIESLGELTRSEERRVGKEGRSRWSP